MLVVVVLDVVVVVVVVVDVDVEVLTEVVEEGVGAVVEITTEVLVGEPTKGVSPPPTTNMKRATAQAATHRIASMSKCYRTITLKRRRSTQTTNTVAVRRVVVAVLRSEFASVRSLLMPLREVRRVHLQSRCVCAL